MANLLGVINTFSFIQLNCIWSFGCHCLSLSVSQATNDLLGPIMATKAPKNNPMFTGTVTGVTADMVTAKARDGSQTTVQNELDRNKDVVSAVAIFQQ